MEVIISKDPLQKNPNCAYCGRVFNAQGLTLQIQVDHKKIDLPICRPCFETVPRFEATVNVDYESARVKR